MKKADWDYGGDMWFVVCFNYDIFGFKR